MRTRIASALRAAQRMREGSPIGRMSLRNIHHIFAYAQSMFDPDANMPRIN